MNPWAALGIVLFLAAVVGGIWYVGHEADKNGYCILVCKWSAEIASARAEATNATERAEDAEGRVETAERSLQGLNPWVIVIAAALVFLMLFLDMALRGEGQGNITLEQGIRKAEQFVRERYGLVSSRENPDEGYYRVLPVSGQVVPGSKDSWMYFIGFPTVWPPGMAYPPDHGCTTVYMLSTDHERCFGVFVGKNPYTAFTAAKTGAAKLQKTASATELAEMLDRTLTEQKIVDAARSVAPTEASE